MSLLAVVVAIVVIAVLKAVMHLAQSLLCPVSVFVYQIRVAIFFCFLV